MKPNKIHTSSLMNHWFIKNEFIKNNELCQEKMKLLMNPIKSILDSSDNTVNGNLNIPGGRIWIA